MPGSIPSERRWQRFATKLQLAARLVEWLAPILKRAGKTVWIVIDGGYALQSVTPVDQFLFSPHIELVAIFRRIP